MKIKKEMKRVLAAVLAFVMVVTGLYIVAPEAKEVVAADNTTATGELFAGYYEEATFETPSAVKTEHAKMVDSSVLSVKVQTSPGTGSTTNMRVLATVDSLNFANVGFDVWFAEDISTVDTTTTKPINFESTQVYKTIDAKEGNVPYSYSPKVVDVDSEYFITGTIKGINANKVGYEFYIRPYWTTYDGTKVYGESKCVAVNDNADNNINMTVRSANPGSAETIKVSVAGTEYDAELLKWEAGYACVNIPVASRSALQSASLVEVTDTSLALEDAKKIYRNLRTFYTSGAASADTSWYTVPLQIDANETEFVIATNKDLYGFASVVNEELVSFEGKTVYQVSDIELNEDSATASANWTSTSAPTNNWVPIGIRKVQDFKGTFDGQNHEIKGLYTYGVTGYVHNASKATANVDDIWYTGLFASANGATIKNSRVLDSYIAGGAHLGAFVGNSTNTVFENLYSNARVHACSENAANNGQSAGITGTLSGGSLTNCWFDGSVTTGGLGYTGGLIGVVNTAKVTITACLNTASVESTGKFVGGFVGWVQKAELEISDSISNAASVKGSTQVGLGVGELNGVGAHFANMERTSVVVVKNGLSLNPLGRNYGDGGTTDIYGTAIAGGTCMTSVATPSAIAGSLGYTATKIQFDRPETTDIEEGYWVTTDSYPVLKSFVEYSNSPVNTEMAGTFRTDIGWAHKPVTEGTDTYYEISTPEELLGFASLVNTSDKSDDTLEENAPKADITFAGKKVVLTNDIVINVGTANASGFALDDTTLTLKTWTPIGSIHRDAAAGWMDDHQNAFMGIFDGQGHTISGLYAQNSSANSTGGNPNNAWIIGLFGVTNNATIQNVSVINSYFEGNYYIAPIVGRADDTVLRNCHTKSFVKANKYAVGGMMGASIGATLENCWSETNVVALNEGNNSRAGGLIGELNAGVAITTTTITNCLNTGNVTGNKYNIGGFIGYQGAEDVTITNSLSAATIDGSANIGSGVGNAASTGTLKIVNSYAYGVYPEGNNIASTIDGIGTSKVIKHNETAITGDVRHTKVIAQIKDKALLTGDAAYLNTQLPFDRTEATEAEIGVFVARKNDLPGLKAWTDVTERLALNGNNKYAHRADISWWLEGVAGETGVTYTISNEEDYAGIALLVNQGSEDFAGDTINLNADLTFNQGTPAGATDSASDDWSTGTVDLYQLAPIGVDESKHFAGTFNGGGNTISGVYINVQTRRGAKNILCSGGLFADTTEATIRNFSLVDSYIQGGEGTAAIASWNSGGTYDSIYTNAIVVCKDGASLKNHGAGIVSLANTASTITNCWFDGTITGQRYLGGMTTLTGATTTISHCLNTGSITGSKETQGGIVGQVSAATEINDSLTVGKISGTGQTGTVVGKHYDGVLTINNVYGYDLGGKITSWVGRVDTEASDNGTPDDTKDDTAKVGDGKVAASERQGAAYAIADPTAYYDMTMLENGLLDDAYWTARVGNLPVPTPFAPAAAYEVDATWYDADATTLTISDEADLYAFALASQTDNFEGTTITLANDITVNDTVVSAQNKASLKEWVPIGSQTVPFAGTFDGQGNVISGLYKNYKYYTKGTVENTLIGQHWVGLFEMTAESSEVKNLYLTDTSFEHNKVQDSTRIGSFAGEGYGKFTNLYSDAQLISGGLGTGGILGVTAEATKEVVNGETTETVVVGDEVTITNCWYNGAIKNIRNAAQDTYVGGLIGFVNTGGNATVTDSSYSGTIDAKGLKIGGLTGAVDNATLKSTGNLLAGTITGNLMPDSSDVLEHPVGTVVGRVKADATTSTVTMSNTWSANDYTEYDIGYEDARNDGVVTVTGEAHMSSSKDRLFGMVSEVYVYENSEGEPAVSTEKEGLDASKWTMRANGVPAQTYFVNAGKNIDSIGAAYDVNNVVEDTKVSTLGKTLADAEHKGAGNYVFTVTGQTTTTFEAYGTALIGAGFTLESKNDNLQAQGVLERTYAGKGWTVNTVYMDGTVYVTISTSQVLSAHLNNADGTNAAVTYTTDGYTRTAEEQATAKTTFTMVELKHSYGNSYVIQLKNGHFIILDGGEPFELPYLMEYLYSLTGGKKPVIEAWVLSHGHEDHNGVFEGLCQDAASSTSNGYAGQLYVEGIYFNEPNSWVTTTYDDGHHRLMQSVKRAAATLLSTSAGERPAIYRMQAGQRYTFDDVTMDIMLTQEQITAANYNTNATGDNPDPFNESSTWTMFTIDGQKVLTAGDASEQAKARIVSLYGQSADSNYLTVDVFTALHHGSNINRHQFMGYGNDSFSKAIQVEGVVLYSQENDMTQESDAVGEYVARRNQNFLNLQPGTIPVQYTQEDGTLGTAVNKNYLYYGEGTCVLTIDQNSITGVVLPNNDWTVGN